MTQDELLDKLLIELSRNGFSLPFMARSRDYENPQELAAADEKAWRNNREALRTALESAEII